MTPHAPITRRRFLYVCAMAGMAAAMPWSHATATIPLHKWKGILLGSEVYLTIAHPDKEQANGIFDKCVTEIKRLENIFTIYDNRSELSQLNHNGYIETPSAELIEIFRRSKTFHQMTGGAFDITVQPLWSLYKKHHGNPPLKDIKASHKLIGMNNVFIEHSKITFKQKHMAATLNGIAQGYITDRVTNLLKQENLGNVLVELGEKRAIGPHPDGRPWQIGVHDGDSVTHIVQLENKALATSSANGLIFDQENGTHHIFDPQTGTNPHYYKSLSVIADTATTADALSTAFTTLAPAKVEGLAEKISGVSKVYKVFS